QDTNACNIPPFATNRHIFDPIHLASSARRSNASTKSIHLIMIHESEWYLQAYPEAM
ncbi:hypothetical protein QBC45DRAFT_313559, partial [Copromyces sp. CBS 386.78]